MSSQAFQEMPTNLLVGLSAQQVQRRLEQFGPNRLFTPAKTSFLRIAGEEITEPMILLLLTVGFFYGLWGKLGDALTIFTVILSLVLVEVYNEFRAKRAITALARIAAPKAQVLRSGKTVSVDAEAIVPGDILVLSAGTHVVADARVIRLMSLALDESALTGESFPLEKGPAEEVFAGTTVVTGEAMAEVTATGARTRIGRMGQRLKQLAPQTTPLQLAMKALAAKLVWVALGVSGGIVMIGILRGSDFRQMVLTGLALAFATIPEELPIIITMVLGLGSYVLSRQNFLVKRIRATETLGSATVIVTDKTGTLTESRMRVASVRPKGTEVRAIQDALGGISPYSPDALDQALLAHAAALGVTPPADEVLRLRQSGNSRRSRATIRREAGKAVAGEPARMRLYLSGAPEEVFAFCAQASADMREALKAETGLGRRVIAVATRPLSSSEAAAAWDEIEQDLELSGLVSFYDPPRSGVKDTLARTSSAGIRTIMVTGDHPATAAAVAREVGIPAEQVLTGSELNQLGDEAMAESLGSVSVYARTLPEHKLRLVRALQGMGEVVVVTGDGINDALALKAADVGIAMGIKGTDVAKEAAQVALADDDYVTIARSLFEGRKLFDNMHKGVTFYLAVKAALIGIFLLPLLRAIPLPFSPIQIILLEFFMDLGASAGFVAEPAESSVYERRARHPEQALIGRQTVYEVLLKGFVLFAGVMAAYLLAWHRGLALRALQTCAFVAWTVGSVVLAFICRCESESIFRHGAFTNRVLNLWAAACFAFLIMAMYLPFLRARLHFGTVAPASFAMSALVAACIVSMAELRKFRIDATTAS